MIELILIGFVVGTVVTLACAHVCLESAAEDIERDRAKEADTDDGSEYTEGQKERLEQEAEKT